MKKNAFVDPYSLFAVKSARVRRKPLALILNSDCKPGCESAKSLEGELRNSQALRKLCRRAVVGMVQSSSPHLKSWMRCFRTWNSTWIVVLNSRGETLASLDAAFAITMNRHKRKISVAAAICRYIEAEFRNRSEQSLEREWRRRPANTRALSRWLIWQLCACRNSYAAEICQSELRNKHHSIAVRETLRVYSFLSHFEYLCGGPVHARRIRQGEKLLASIGNHFKAKDVCFKLWHYLASSFDVAQAVAESCARLKKAAKSPSALRIAQRHARFLNFRLNFMLVRMRASKKKSMHVMERLRYAGAFGDATETLRLLGRAEFKDCEQQGWHRTARKRLAEDKKRTSAR